MSPRARQGTGSRAVLVLLLILVVQACSGDAPPPGPPYQTATPAEFQAVMDAQDGAVAVAVMSASCSPCLKELPMIEALRKELGPQGLTVLGLSLDYDQTGLEFLLDTTGISFPVYWTGERAIEALDIGYLPLVILLRDGREVKRLEGLHDEDELRAEFTALLRGS